MSRFMQLCITLNYVFKVLQIHYVTIIEKLIINELFYLNYFYLHGHM